MVAMGTIHIKLTMTRSHTPRPQCLESPPCTAWKTAAGCGWLDAGAPCHHPIERRRFDAAGRDVTALPGLQDESDIEIVTGHSGPQLAFEEVLL